MQDSVSEFHEYRDTMNRKILEADNITQCVKAGVTDTEFHAAMVGGSITIPHLRYAFDLMDKVRSQDTSHGSST